MKIWMKIEMKKVSLASIAAETVNLFLYYNQLTFFEDK